MATAMKAPMPITMYTAVLLMAELLRRSGGLDGGRTVGRPTDAGAGGGTGGGHRRVTRGGKQLPGGGGGRRVGRPRDGGGGGGTGGVHRRVRRDEDHLRGGGGVVSGGACQGELETLDLTGHFGAYPLPQVRDDHPVAGRADDDGEALVE